jgi:hypothetical protein
MIPFCGKGSALSYVKNWCTRKCQAGSRRLGASKRDRCRVGSIQGRPAGGVRAGPRPSAIQGGPERAETRPERKPHGQIEADGAGDRGGSSSDGNGQETGSRSSSRRRASSGRRSKKKNARVAPCGNPNLYECRGKKLEIINGRTI